MSVGRGAAGFFGGGEAQQVAPRTFFVPGFANVAVLETDDGLMLVDTCSRQGAARAFGQARALTKARVHTVVFTHGHVDHAFGLGPWLDEAERDGAPRPRIVAHRNVIRRFREYSRMPGLNEHINSIQFGGLFGRGGGVRWPREFYWPDTIYDDALSLSIGGERFELRHGRGETDDATWVWAPERKVLCAGDFWIGCSPNAGNPQKVQRYAEDWADVLETMAALGAEVLLPGHGPVWTGRDRISAALADAAALLRSIVEQTLQALNDGLRHDEILERVEVPHDLVSKPYLEPVYDRPEFIVRNLIRLHGGWWDGFAASLLPSPPTSRAGEIARLAGGVDRLVERARELADDDLPLACHLAEWAALAEPASRAAQECVRDVFARRADQEISLMGRGVYTHAVREAERMLE